MTEKIKMFRLFSLIIFLLVSVLAQAQVQAQMQTQEQAQVQTDSTAQTNDAARADSVAATIPSASTNQINLDNYISYTSPKEYEIADITVTGVNII